MPESYFRLRMRRSLLDRPREAWTFCLCGCQSPVTPVIRAPAKPYQGHSFQLAPTFTMLSRSWIAMEGNAAPPNVTVLVPKSNQSYSMNSDRLLTTAYSRPPPTVKPDRVPLTLEAITPAPGTKAEYLSFDQAPPPFT